MRWLASVAFAGAALAFLTGTNAMPAAPSPDPDSGPSFDCAKAQTAGEQIVCNDVELSQADRKMAAAYARLKRTETPESFATVRDSQRAWLAHLMRGCNANGKLPDDAGARNTIKDCLTDDYTSRADHLHASEVARAEPLTLEPRMRYFQRAKPDTQESDIYPWMSGDAKAAAFNAWIAKTLQLSKRRMDDKQLFPFNDLPPDMKLSADRSYRVIRFDQRIASLQVSTYDFSGGAHEVLGESSLNWDVKNAKPITLADVFKPGSAWRKFVDAYCLKDLHAQIAQRRGSGPEASGIDPVVKDGANWLFAKDHAVVHFTVYAVASFADGEFDVEIPYKVLQPYLRPDAPVTP